MCGQKWTKTKIVEQPKEKIWQYVAQFFALVRYCDISEIAILVNT